MNLEFTLQSLGDNRGPLGPVAERQVHPTDHGPAQRLGIARLFIAVHRAKAIGRFEKCVSSLNHLRHCLLFQDEARQ